MVQFFKSVFLYLSSTVLMEDTEMFKGEFLQIHNLGVNAIIYGSIPKLTEVMVAADLFIYLSSCYQTFILFIY